MKETDILIYANEKIEKLTELKADAEEEIATLQVFLEIRTKIPKKIKVTDKIRFKEQEVAEYGSDLRFWQQIRESLKPCQKCDGFGSVIMSAVQDESRSVSCPACGGSGIRKKE